MDDIKQIPEFETLQQQSRIKLAELERPSQIRFLDLTLEEETECQN